MSGGAKSSRGVVDLTDDADAAEDASGTLSLLSGLKAALSTKRRERKDAERIAQKLREEEDDLLVSIGELEEQEESARRERNRPDWAKAKFQWDCKVMELLQKTFKLPQFRALQREVLLRHPPPLLAHAWTCLVDAL
jgi:chromosome segregation ATPase